MEIKHIEVDGRLLRVGIRPWAPDTVPLLLFNGIGANLELVRPFADALGRHGCIIFDVPGVGGSPAPLLPYRFSGLCRLATRLLDLLGVTGKVDVLGVSWGGALAQQFAYQYPERCRKLVLAATTAGTVMVPGKIGTISKLANPRRYIDADFMREIGAEIYGGAFRTEPEIIDRHGKQIKPPTGIGYVYQLLAGLGWTSIHWLHRVKQPTLVMMGTDDPIVPPINGEILAALIPNARLFTIDDGHLFIVSRLSEVLPVILQFLAEEPDRSAGARTIG